MLNAASNTAAKDALRQAATVILVAPSQSSKVQESNYRVLMMKRSKNMKFMPGVHVFPGGSVDKTDHDNRWSELLGAEKPSSLLAERVAAVRETFEESGILLAHPRDTVAKIPKDDLKHWRTQVLEDGSNFFKLCEKYHIRPAVNDLIEWSIWVTPVIESRRFFTRFFLAILPTLPTDAIHENNESVSTDWLRPQEAIDMYYAKQVKLIPPQFYTMLELASCPDIKQVPNLHGNQPVIPFQPEFLQDDDNLISALPGDPLHPNGAKAPHHRHRILFSKGASITSSTMTLLKNLDDNNTSKL